MIRPKGFTLVELIVVVTVIGILATLATIGMARYLETSRDDSREANITTIAEALEKYYDKNGEYPSCAAISGDGTDVATDVLAGIDESALLVPNADDGVTNSISCNVGLSPEGGDDYYLYTGDGTADCTGSVACTSYSLTYRKETQNSLVTLDSRRVTPTP